MLSCRYGILCGDRVRLPAAAIIIVIEFIRIRDAGLDIAIRIGPAIAVISRVLA